jgi:sporulation protein YqfC
MLTKILSHFDLPEDALGSVPRLTVTGTGGALIENHRGLDVLDEREVVISCVRGRITLRGEGLALASMTGAEMCITGTICSVELERR